MALRLYVLSISARRDVRRKGKNQIATEHQVKWLILDEGVDPGEEAEFAMEQEWFPESERWYDRAACWDEVPFDKLHEIVEFNLREREEQPRRRSSQYERPVRGLQQRSGGRHLNARQPATD